MLPTDNLRLYAANAGLPEDFTPKPIGDMRPLLHSAPAMTRQFPRQVSAELPLQVILFPESLYFRYLNARLDKQIPQGPSNRCGAKMLSLLPAAGFDHELAGWPGVFYEAGHRFTYVACTLAGVIVGAPPGSLAPFMVGWIPPPTTGPSLGGIATVLVIYADKKSLAQPSVGQADNKSIVQPSMCHLLIENLSEEVVDEFLSTSPTDPATSAGLLRRTIVEECVRLDVNFWTFSNERMFVAGFFDFETNTLHTTRKYYTHHGGPTVIEMLTFFVSESLLERITLKSRLGRVSPRRCIRPLVIASIAGPPPGMNFAALSQSVPPSSVASNASPSLSPSQEVPGPEESPSSSAPPEAVDPSKSSSSPSAVNVNPSQQEVPPMPVVRPPIQGELSQLLMAVDKANGILPADDHGEPDLPSQARTSKRRAALRKVSIDEPQRGKSKHATRPRKAKYASSLVSLQANSGLASNDGSVRNVSRSRYDPYSRTSGTSRRSSTPDEAVPVSLPPQQSASRKRRRDEDDEDADSNVSVANQEEDQEENQEEEEDENELFSRADSNGHYPDQHRARRRKLNPEDFPRGSDGGRIYARRPGDKRRIYADEYEALQSNHSDSEYSRRRARRARRAKREADRRAAEEIKLMKDESLGNPSGDEMDVSLLSPKTQMMNALIKENRLIAGSEDSYGEIDELPVPPPAGMPDYEFSSDSSTSSVPQVAVSNTKNTVNTNTNKNKNAGNQNSGNNNSNNNNKTNNNFFNADIPLTPEQKKSIDAAAHDPGTMALLLRFFQAQNQTELTRQVLNNHILIQAASNLEERAQALLSRGLLTPQELARLPALAALAKSSGMSIPNELLQQIGSPFALPTVHDSVSRTERITTALSSAAGTIEHCLGTWITTAANTFAFFKRTEPSLCCRHQRQFCPGSPKGKHPRNPTADEQSDEQPEQEQSRDEGGVLNTTDNDKDNNKLGLDTEPEQQRSKSRSRSRSRSVSQTRVKSPYKPY